MFQHSRLFIFSQAKSGRPGLQILLRDRAAHTLKGVTQNLSFTRLYQSTHEITEALRTQNYELAAQLFPKVEADYIQTAAAIQAYQKS